MMMSTVVAVALGLAPVKDSPAAQLVQPSPQALISIGRYSQSTDARGTTRIRGVDGRGQCYELIMDRKGHVEALVGEKAITFDVSEAV